MNKTALKSCPFCGSNQLCQQWCDRFIISCLFCSAEITDRESEEVCAAKWNQRTFTVTEDSLVTGSEIQKRVEECKRKIMESLFVPPELLGNSDSGTSTANEINMINSAIIERLTGSRTYFVDKTNHNQKGSHDTAKNK